MPASMVLRFLTFAVAASIALIACDAEPSPSGHGPGPSSLAGTSWTLLTVNGRPPVATAPPTLNFTDTGASGSGGCNGYGGTYRYEPTTGSIAFTDMGMTLMLCVDNGRNLVESVFFQALTAANRVAVDADGRLHLAGPAGEIVLVSGVQPGATD